MKTQSEHRLRHLALTGQAMLKSTSLVVAVGITSSATEAYPIDCAIFLCLAGGWPSDPDCNAARAEFVRRITPWPIEPPLQLWRCPMGATSGSINLSPMQRLEAIKDSSANPIPELPPADQDTPQVVDASYSTESWNALGLELGAIWAPLDSSVLPWAHLGADTPAIPTPTLAAVDLSTSDFDIIRSIRVWDVRHYSYRRRSRDDEQCRTSLDMVVGTYDQNANFHWSDRAPGPIPGWIPLRGDCPSYFRGVGVEWSDIFGRSDHELVPY